MKSVELNPIGNFDQWDIEKIKELHDGEFIKKSTSQKLLYESGASKLWDITLWPNQRIPFRKYEFPCSFICMTSGLTISRYGNGKIELIQFEKGDTEYREPDEENPIYDIENIGESVIKMYVLEFCHKIAVAVH